MEKIAVAKALKPQGIKGEIKFKVLLNSGESLDSYKSFILDKREVKVENIRYLGEFCFIKFEGINSVVEADLLRNKMLYINKEDLIEDLQDGEYLIEDMIGKMCVFENGEELGEVTDIENYGSADVYYVKKKNGKEVLFSYVVGVIMEVKENKIVLNKKKFLEVSV